MEKRKCARCGKSMVYGYTSNKGPDICESCFHKEFWEDALDEDALIIDGSCYHAGDEDDKSPFRGFGGSKLYIQMLDTNKVIVTTNLWCQGEIPAELNVKDNAKFIVKEM